MKYNWKAIKRISGNDCKKCLTLLRALTYGPRGSSTVMALAKLKEAGELVNWIDNPKGLFNSKASTNNICVYLELSSMRNMYLTQITGDYIPVSYLTLTHFTIDKLRWNELLTIEDDKIYFKY